MIEKPEIVLFDSSNWINLFLKSNVMIKDNFLRLYCKNLIPLFTYPNLIEILTTNDYVLADEELLKRILYLNSISHLATLKYKDSLGSVGDLHCFEAEGLVLHKLRSQSELKEYINSKISLEPLNIDTTLNAIEVLKDVIINSKNKAKSASAINRYAINVFYNMKMKTFKDAVIDTTGIKRNDDIFVRISSYFKEKKIDIVEAEKIKLNFFSIFENHLKRIKDRIPVYDFIKQICSVENISDNRPFKYYMNLYEFNYNLMLISQDTNISFEELKQIPPDSFFSIKLRLTAFDMLQKLLFNDKRRGLELSNTIDIDLVTYSLYFKVASDIRTIDLMKKVEKKLPVDLNIVHANNFKL